MPRNVLFVLPNGDPAEWALLELEDDSETEEEVRVLIFTDVPDDVAATIKDTDKPKTKKTK